MGDAFAPRKRKTKRKKISSCHSVTVGRITLGFTANRLCLSMPSLCINQVLWLLVSSHLVHSFIYSLTYLLLRVHPMFSSSLVIFFFSFSHEVSLVRLMFLAQEDHRPCNRALLSLSSFFSIFYDTPTAKKDNFSDIYPSMYPQRKVKLFNVLSVVSPH